MSRAELLLEARARGVAAPPHVVEYMAQAGKFTPAPRLDGSHRRVFEAVHVEQVVAHVRRRVRAVDRAAL